MNVGPNDLREADIALQTVQCKCKHNRKQPNQAVEMALGHTGAPRSACIVHAIPVIRSVHTPSRVWCSFVHMPHT